MPKEEIVVVARLVDKLTGGLQTVRQKMNQFGQVTSTVTKKYEQLSKGSRNLVGQTKKVTSIANSARIAQSSFGEVMSMNFEHWKKFNQVGGKFKTVGGKVANTTRNMVHGMRGFRMEMLSVMFGGQMLQKAMFGLLKPALQVAGAFEIWGAMLQVLFLPVALFLLENVFLPLFNLFSNLPEPIQKVIGFFVLFVGVIGAILAVGGALVLFIGGMVIAWGTLNAIFIASPIGWIVLAIAAVVVSIILIITYTTYLWNNWDKVWTWIKEHPAIAAVISFVFPLIAIITAIVGVVKYLYENWSEIWNSIKETMKPVGDWFNKWIIDPISSAWSWLMDTLKKGWDWIKGIGGKIGEFFGFGDKGEGALSSNQSGGYVPHTGMYKLHAGENVSQAGSSSFSPTINVNASSNVDIEMLKTQLSTQWNDDLGRLSRG